MIASTLIALSLQVAPADSTLLASVVLSTPQDTKRRDRSQAGRNRQDERNRQEGRAGRGKGKDDSARSGEQRDRGTEKNKGDRNADKNNDKARETKEEKARKATRQKRAAERAANPRPPPRPSADNKPTPGQAPPPKQPIQIHRHAPGSNKPKHNVKPFEPGEEAKKRAAAAAASLAIKRAPPTPSVRDEVEDKSKRNLSSGAIRLSLEEKRAIALEQKKHRERLARIHRLIEIAALLQREDSNEDLEQLQQGELDRHERVLAEWRGKIGERSLHRALQIANGL